MRPTRSSRRGRILLAALPMFAGCSKSGDAPPPAIAPASVSPAVPPVPPPPAVAPAPPLLTPPVPKTAAVLTVEDLSTFMPAPLRPDQAAGKWTAKVTGARIERNGVPVPVPPPSSGDTFDFEIVYKEGQFFMDGPQPVPLKRDGRTLTGEAKGVTTRLHWMDDAFAGEMVRKAPDSDARFVVEFTAVRAR